MSAAENVELVRKAYTAISTGDIPWIQEHTSPDVVFFQGGRFPTAGTFPSRDAMFGHYMEFMQMVEGQFSIEVRDVLASDEHAVGLASVTIKRGDEAITFDEAHVFRIADGLVVEMWALPKDPYEVDAFFAR